MQLRLALLLLVEQPEVVKVVISYCAVLNVFKGYSLDLINFTKLINEQQQPFRQWLFQCNTIGKYHHLEIHPLSLVMNVFEEPRF